MTLIGLALLVLFTQQSNEKIKFGFNKSIIQPENYKTIWPFTGFIIYFLWITISLLWSQNTNDWFHDVVGKLSLLGIPFIFLFTPKLKYQEIKLIHYFYFGVIAISSLLIISIYIPQFNNITLRIGSGRPIPTPIDHVRFSMMVSYACLSSLALGIIEFKKNNRSSSIIILTMALAFFAFCHILAVRSGLILLYSGIAILIIYFILTYKAYIVGILALFAMIFIPFTAYQTIPSFKNKVLYTKYDIQKSISNEGGNYSDGDRIRSIKNGIQLWKKNPILGLGAGDYKAEMKTFYINNQQTGRQLLPHNQWIRSGMAYGLIGVIILFLAFILVLIRNKGYQNILLLLIIQLLFFSLLVESNLERYYALVFFFIFIGINAQLEPFKPSKQEING